MILNYEEIKSKNIIEEFTEKEFTDGSYNLTISHIIDMSNNVTDSFTLKPQGMAYVIFKEKMNVPENIIGFAHVKTSLTKRGIMATNIGIIDPSYKGYISTLLINFGKSDCLLSNGDSALRITFANIKTPTEKKVLLNNNQDFESYKKKTRRNISKLDEKFLNLTSVKNDVTSTVSQRLLAVAIVFTAGSFLLSAYFNHKSSSEKDLEKTIKNFQTEVSTINQNNKLLKEQLNIYQLNLKSLRDSIYNKKSTSVITRGTHAN